MRISTTLKTIIARPQIITKYFSLSYGYLKAFQKSKIVKYAFRKFIKQKGGIPLQIDKTSLSHELTLRCNLSCKMCFGMKNREDILSNKNSDYAELEYNDIIKILKNSYFSVISLVGNEVFLREDLFLILDYFRDKNIKFSISTNGTLLNENIVLKLKTYRSLLTSIIFSLDGKEEIHNKIRGSESAFEQTCRAIELSAAHFNTFINTTIMEDNIYDLKSMVDIVLSLGVRNLNFSLEFWSSREAIERTKYLLNKEFGWNNPVINVYQKQGAVYTFDELMERLEELFNYAYKKRIFVSFSPESRVLRSYFYEKEMAFPGVICKKLLFPNPRIDYKGDFIFCHTLRKSWGNLLKQSADEVWESKEFIDFRWKLYKIGMLPICKRCCKLCAVY